MPLRLFYTDRHELPLPPGHKFPITKYRMLRERLEAFDRNREWFNIQPAPMATARDAELAHDSGYVRAFLEGALTAQEICSIGFPYSEFLVRRTMASLGGTLAAARHALEHGMSGCLAGGTHHAFRSQGAGFCVFNDMAAAVRANGLRAAVVDLDVHQGDGTASIFEGDDSVLTFSMHGARNFPFRKQRSRIDIELPDQTENETYLKLLEETLPSVWNFAPRLLFFQAGVDVLQTDRLGRLALTQEGLKERDRLVMEGAMNRGIPLVITLGGGYSEPIEATVDAHANTFIAAARIFRNQKLTAHLGSGR